MVLKISWCGIRYDLQRERQPAVDGDGLPRDERRVLGAEEPHRVRDVPAVSVPTHRVLRADVGLE